MDEFVPFLLFYAIYTTQKKKMPPYIKCDISVDNWYYDLILGSNLDSALVKMACKYDASKCLESGNMETGSTGSQNRKSHIFVKEEN